MPERIKNIRKSKLEHYKTEGRVCNQNSTVGLMQATSNVIMRMRSYLSNKGVSDKSISKCNHYYFAQP